MPIAITAPRRSPPGPQTATLAACELLTWIGLGRPQTWEDLNAEIDHVLRLWTTTNLPAVEAALAGRAAPQPYCAVYPFVDQHAASGKVAVTYADRVVSPRGPQVLRDIRRRARATLGRLVDYPELLAMVRAAQHANATDDRRIAEAAGAVMEALRAGRLVAYGLPSHADGDPDRRAAHRPVPLGVLLHPTATIHIDDHIGPDIAADAGTWLERRSLAFHDVQFQTAEVLSLWPVQTPPPVRLDDLPADWTLIEAMAWIMLRDPAVVRDAAPETMREGGTFYAEHRLPDGRKEMIAETGAPGVGLRRLTMLAVFAKLDTPDAAVVTADEAESALLAALRAGKLTAHGKPYGTDPRTMEPRDWRGLILHEQQHGKLIAAPSKEIGQQWWNVTLSRSEITAQWPPREALDVLPSAPPSGSKPKVRNMGGRPVRDDWLPFDHEVARRLALDGGNLTLTGFRRIMKEWAAGNMQPVPDDRTIERQIDRRAPRDVFVSD